MSFARKTLKNSTPLTLVEAKRKLMDLVARRDHSVKELRQKLLQRCEPEIVDQVLQWAEQQNWLAPPEKIKNQIAEQLSRRGKGIRKINQKLKELGLDSVRADLEDEFEKAKRLVGAKWTTTDFKGLDFKEAQKLKAKVMRFLAARGFESAVISKILKTELKTISSSEDAYDEEF